MPNISRNSSSAFTKPPSDQEQSYIPVQAESTQLNPIESDDANDWFVGTEELLDALPRPWSRSIVYVLIGFAALLLPWAMFSKVDETGSARGRIEPLGATRKLDSQALGSVTAVKVKEGDTVKAGQVLVELESQVLRTDLQQAEAKLSGLQNQRSQLELLKNQVQLAIRVQEQQNRSQELEKISQINQAQQNLDTSQSNFNLQKLEKQTQIEQAKQKINPTQTTAKLAKNRLNTDLAEIKRYRELAQQGVVAQVRVVDSEKEAQQTQNSLIQAQSEFHQAQLALKEQESKYQSYINQALSDIKQAKLRLAEQQNSYQSVVNTGKLAVLKTQEQFKDLQSQISTLQSQIAQTGSQTTSLKLQLQQRVVRSPVDGVIFELPIKKPGPVVQPGQMIAQIAPKETPLVLKAQMPIEHSGFLKVGMPVKMKFDAFPFQDYGVVPGKVNWIAPDSKVSQSTSGNIQTFELEITLQQPYIKTENKQTLLMPGQTATAEVIIRQRRVIDFLLDPFTKLHKDGLAM